ncbi:MAG: exosome complex RNA-binding protein Csl4 [Candidatus Micrarchaeia archaeon]|jgi:exosome complex component CSL4
MDKKPRVVTPGEHIGTEEEYVAGSGTFIKDEGIYSSIFGHLMDKDRTLSVSANAQVTTPSIGAKIIGRIEAIIDPIAIVSIEKIEDGTNMRFSNSGARFILKAPNIKKGYVKSVRDEYKIGDIIRAKIITESNGEYHLSTEDDDCGCIKAFASGPQDKRYALIKTASGLVNSQCPDKKENRKMAADYYTKE